MTKTAKTPRYQVLNDELKTLIRSGQYQRNQRFLTEREISERFGVSRATANKALSMLATESLVEFRKGVGTFVRSAVLDYDLRSLVSFTDKARAAGLTPTTQVLMLETKTFPDLPDVVVSTLDVQAADTVYYFERLRCADEKPVILEQRYMLARDCPGLTLEQLNGSLYSLWVVTFGLEIVGADETIRAILLDEREAALLQVAIGSPSLLVISVGYTVGEKPLWYEQTLYRGDSYEFLNRLGPIQAARPAAGSLIRSGKESDSSIIQQDPLQDDGSQLDA